MKTKLINKLIVESTQELHGYDDRFGNTTTTVFDKEKFAELIIGECLEVLRLVPYDAGGPAFGDEVIYQEAIKTYFGVK